MPTVPSYNSQAQSSSLSGGGFNAAPVTNSQPQQLQQLGDSALRSGQALSSIAIDMQQQANQVRVDASLNKLRQQALDLTYNEQNGYKALRGDAALTRPNGQALPEEYGAKLQTTISEIESGLGNDAQRQAFSSQAAGLLTQFRGSVEQHALEEYRSYSLSTQDGTIKLGADEAKLNWNDPNKIKSSLESVKAAVVRTGTLSGWSANETTAKLRETTSAVHMGVIDTALQQNNPEYALGYVDRFKDEMTADDLLRVRGVINKDVYQRLADDIATNVVGGARQQSAPSDIGRMINITMQTESGGNPDAEGPMIPGQGTAKGLMQVMDATNRDPGYGVKPAQNDSKEERARVGRDVLQAMVKKYSGDAAKAWAAYNWGPGKVDAAIKEHGSGWLAHAPRETQSYVAKNLAALESGGGTAKPTLQDVHDRVRAQVTQRFGPTPPANVLKLALATSTQQFQDMRKAEKDDEEARTTAAMQALVQNGGRFNNLPYAVRSQIPADQVDNVLSFAARIAKGEDTTNPAVYQRLSDPAALRSLSEGQFYLLRSELSEADFKHFSTQRAAALDKSTNKLEEINMPAMNFVLANRMEALGIPRNPKGDDAARLGTIKQFISDAMIQQQRTTGKQMTDSDVSQFIDGLFAKSVTFRTSMLGIDTGTTSQRLLSLKANDIPSGTRDALIADFKAAGIADPTDSDLLGAYLRLQNSRTKRATTVKNPFQGSK